MRSLLVVTSSSSAPVPCRSEKREKLPTYGSHLRARVEGGLHSPVNSARDAVAPTKHVGRTAAAAARVALRRDNFERVGVVAMDDVMAAAAALHQLHHAARLQVAARCPSFQ